ncbi:unnamed protein product [marine sediment metagenome]|uniref:Uncharacterized protein n=1 Tax=marine sediment metagenome TaxID=412755 RepID=X1HTY2_9ZZZZ
MSLLKYLRYGVVRYHITVELSPLGQFQDRKARWLNVLYRDIESSEIVLGKMRSLAPNDNRSGVSS